MISVLGNKEKEQEISRETINNIESAIRDFTKAMNLSDTIDHSYKSALYQRANAYFMIHKYDSAIRDLDSLIQLGGYSDKPNNELHFIKAITYLKSDLHTLALGSIDTAIAIKSDNKYYAIRAEIYTKLGRPEDALADYSRILD